MEVTAAADMNQIHDFAVKWIDKFRDQQINYIELVEPYMADDCDGLGFEMDCGHAFEHVYGKAASNCEELDKIIDDVTDISMQMFYSEVLQEILRMWQKRPMNTRITELPLITRRIRRKLSQEHSTRMVCRMILRNLQIQYLALCVFMV